MIKEIILNVSRVILINTSTFRALSKKARIAIGQTNTVSNTWTRDVIAYVYECNERLQFKEVFYF